MLFKASRSSGSVIFENVRISSETLTLPSISLRMLRRSRARSLVLPVASIRPLPVLVRIDRRFILCCGSVLSSKPAPAVLLVVYYRPERPYPPPPGVSRSEEHTSELQSHVNLVCRLLLEKKKRHRQHLVVFVSAGEMDEAH